MTETTQQEWNLLDMIRKLEQRCDDQERRLEEHENRYSHECNERY